MGAPRKFLFLLFSAFWLGCGPALAEKRVALVIGNSAYKNVARLTNPVNDATLVAAMFRNARFDSVVTKLDVNISEMRKALREFGATARDADVAVIYYAGHGIELDGNNYLIPTDATLETDTDVLDETFPLDRVLFAVEPAKQLRLVILDACRDNPFEKTMKRTVGSRAIGRGLAKVEPNSPNTMIAFAAKAGSIASDGDSKNSPFAAALVEYLPRPGLDLRKAFGFVRDDVLKNTGYKQEPYVYGSLGGDDVPLVPAKSVATSPQPNPEDAVRRDYELALQLGTRDGWNAFLARYPNGFYADLARGQVNKIAAEEARAAAAEKAQLAEQERAHLAAEGANKDLQTKAAAEVKVANEARLTAERTKQIEQAKADAAEQARVAAEGAAAAALPPSVSLSRTDIVKSVQLELRRVGCLTAAADGEWNSVSQRSLIQFNKHAETKFDVKLANAHDLLDVIKAKPARVCPLICDHGYKTDGERCVKVICRSGYEVDDDNACEKIQSGKPATGREKTARPKQARTEVSSVKPEVQERQIVCGSGGCRPVRKGCRITQVPAVAGGMRNGEVCN
jgi:uncharacterized caspase-like protein